MTPAMHSRPNRLLARGTSAVLLAIGALALVHSLDWRGARFPGFFVMPNRVVPSAALAAVASERSAEGELYRGLAAFGWASAAFGFTAMDLYGPGGLFRLHVLSEALLWAAAKHLVLAYPEDRVTGRAGVLPLVYGVGLAFAAVYEFFAYEPGAYSALHNLSQALAGLPVPVLGA